MQFSPFVVLTLCGPYPLWSLLFVVLIFCGPYPLWSLPCVVLIFCGPYPLWSIPFVVCTLCVDKHGFEIYYSCGRVWSGLVGWLDNMGIRLNSAPIEVGVAWGWALQYILQIYGFWKYQNILKSRTFGIGCVTFHVYGFLNIFWGKHVAISLCLI